ncbi:MAG: PIN domain-containing protein [Verrucomicrobiae bacterium]|nr:PIN domain-containing protein [Verrucomicrobiae bacterium]
MILPDINLLIHAHNLESPRHEGARQWWDDALAGTVGIGLAWVTLLGFIRICTHRGILLRPMTPAGACSRVREWLTLPHVHLALPAQGHFERLSAHLSQLGTAGNLTTDAHLATLAMERGYVLCTTDSDFVRFPGLKWRNPLEP